MAVADPFQGRYQLGERLPCVRGLARYRVGGVTLEEPAEGLVVSGARRWQGLAEAVWWRLCHVQAAFPGLAPAPLAVEHAGDQLLILHAPLDGALWSDPPRAAGPAAWRSRLATVAELLATLARRGWSGGNLRLETLRWLVGEGSETLAVPGAPAPAALPAVAPAVAPAVVPAAAPGAPGKTAAPAALGGLLRLDPAAYALPLPLLAARGLVERPWRRGQALGEAAGLALDLARLAHALARRAALAAVPGADGAPARAVARDERAELLALARELAVLGAAGSRGEPAAGLASRLEEAAAAWREPAGPRAGGKAREALARAPAAAASAAGAAPPGPDGLAAAVQALARAGHSALLAWPGGEDAEREARAALAAALPAAADLAVARGLGLETVVPAAGGEEDEAWLLARECPEQPPAAAARWLARTRGRRRKVLLLAAAETDPIVAHLLRWTLRAHGGLAEIAPPAAPRAESTPPAGPERAAAAGGAGEPARPAAPVRSGPGAPARSAAPAGETPPDRDARLVLCLLAAADLALPLAMLAQFAQLPGRRCGECLAQLAGRGWLTVEVLQVGWVRGELVGAARLTRAGREAAAWLAGAQSRRAYLDLLLHGLPPARRPEWHWLRFRLQAAAGADAEAGRELAALLAADAGVEEFLAIGACAEAMAPNLSARLPSPLLARAALRLGLACQAGGLLDEAQALFERGLRMAAPPLRRPPTLEEAETGASVLVALADLLDKRGEFGALYALLHEQIGAYELALPLPLRAKLQFELAWAHYRLGQHDAALEICHQLQKQLDVDAYPAESAEVFNLIGVIRYESSRYEEARISIQKGLVLRERVGDRAAVARSCNNLGMVHLALGDPGRADSALKRSLDIKRAAGDLPGVASCLLNLAYVALEQQLPELARERGEQALGIAREHGLQQLAAEALLVLGEANEAQERLEAAAGWYEEALQQAVRIGDEDQILAVRRPQAALWLRRGDLERARRCYEEAAALRERVPSRLQRALLQELQADLLAAGGELEPAAEIYEQAADALAALHKPEQTTRAQARAALAWLRAGHAERARELFEDLRGRALESRPGRLPEEYHELERRLGDAERRPGAERPFDELLQGLLALPDLEAQRLGFGALARRVVDLLYASGAFVEVGFSLLSPTGESVGRWERPRDRAAPGEAEAEDAGARAGARGGDAAALSVHHRWPDGSEIVGAARLARAAAAGGRGSGPRDLRDQAARALGLVASFLAGYRARLGEAAPVRDGADGAAAPRAGEAEPAGPGALLIGVSESLAELRRAAEKVADLEAHVLIQGENGSGKEVVARLIHQRSARRREPFVAVNCASIPASLLESSLFGHEKGAFTDAHARHVGEFERAGAGTILLDEIGEMPLPLQPKLLRVLQEREFRRVGGGEAIRLRARVLAATNLDLEEAVADGRFRQDLYYRLAVIPIRVPPLRERPQDVPVLLRHFLETYAAEFGVPVCVVAPDALEALMAAPWPGNVRELENLARRLLIFAEGGAVHRSDLPPAIGGARAAPAVGLEELAARIARLEELDPDDPLLPRLQGLLARNLVARYDNKALVARLLGISPPTLYEWLRRERNRRGDEPPREKASRA